eukprot:CAMPEP_0116118030 /NCGR_PEP_ID=MMETSP0329-20121206/1887_1 /TAXON_ID=697910 /ORGANISM="Pseudo-nitzschia arenysensis, Strain B593" /LENGTH=565 /DNA_ID=CAMNT_0003611631 /DNA_START=66 /DNA_END=1760 /DNA_ORIENTATION=-
MAMIDYFSLTMNRFRSIVMNSTDAERLKIEFPSPLINSEMATEFIKTASQDPETLFKCLMGTLVATGITAKAWPYLKSSTSNLIGSKSKSAMNTKSPQVALLQKRYLPVFYLFRMSFWMSGPYFYQAYLSKTLRHLDGTTSQATSEFVARVSLVGYLAIVLLGPMVGRAIDRYSRRTATICTGAMYALGSLSVFSDLTIILYLGRAMASIASSRLTSSPEAWLIQEYLQIKKQERAAKKETKDDGLSETFGLAYGGDAIVAILAGQTASLAAAEVGHPTGPFLVSPLVVAVALMLTAYFWIEHKASPEATKTDCNACEDKTNDKKEEVQNGGCSMRAGVIEIFSDPKILLVGLVQSLFEGSMYIFVLVWPPALSSIIRSSFGESAATPFGTIFSCFMACCLLGSVLFGQFQKKAVNVKHIMAGILLVSTGSFLWSVSAIQAESLFGTIASFFAFEACVGMYFPSIGIIRSELLPESHRCAIMTLFAVPLNVLVVGVISFQPVIGDVGSLKVAGFAMGVAAMCMVLLERTIRREEEEEEEEEMMILEEEEEMSEEDYEIAKAVEKW